MAAVSQGRVQTKLEENLWEREGAKGKAYFWTPRIKDPVTGKSATQWIRLDASTRTEAKLAKKRMIKAQLEGKVRTKSDVTWADLAREYMDDQQAKRHRLTSPLSKSTLEYMEGNYRIHVSHFERFGRVDNIDVSDVEAWLVELQTKLGHSAFKQVRSLARRIFALHVHKYGGENPFDNVNPDKIPPREKRRKRKPPVPRPDGLYAFLATIDDEDVRFTATLIAFSGMRASEALGVERKNVFLDENKLVVAQQLYRGELKAAAKTPAGDDRVIPLTPFIKEELRIRMETIDNDFLCVDEYGLAVPAWRVRNHVMKAAERLGLQHTTTHHLRGWFNSTLRRAGVDEMVIKQIVGHETEEDMTDLYTHPYAEEDLIRTVLDALEQFGFGQVGGEVLVG